MALFTPWVVLTGAYRAPIVGLVKTVLLAALLVTLAAPGTATADRPERANEVALEVWGPALAEVCPDGLTLTYGVPEDPAVFGWAWQNVCEIGISTNQPLLDHWPALCDTVIHEAGHVLGYDHDHAAHGGVMLDSVLMRDVMLIGRRKSVRWGGVHPACKQPRPKAPPLNMAYASGTSSPRGVT
jgi:hypothetical protein